MDIVAGKKYYTSLDLKSAYNQIPVVREDQHKTAFISPLGLYQFVRMPFGLINAPATFQRIMINLFRDNKFENVVCYLDDIVIFSDNVDQHVETIDRVLSKLEEVGLKLNVDKCKFFKSKILFLGHKVSERGLEADDEKLKAVRDWPTPKSLREVRTLLGFCSYYRKFVKGFSGIVAPLNKLIVEVNEKEGKPVSRRRSKGVNVEWNTECDQAFTKLKTALCSSPILVVPNWDEKFIVETDASASGLGAVLSQIVGKYEKRVVAYASRSLRRGEQNKSNYSSKKLEFLAVVWAITEKFSYYLRGSSCVVITDNSAVSYISHKKELTSLEQRWMARLADYDITYKYRPGKENVVADALSRVRNIGNGDTEIKEYDDDEVELGLVETVPMMERDKLRIEQNNDSVIRKALLIASKNGYVGRLVVRDGVLYEKREGYDDRLMVPSSLVGEVLRGAHEDNGHQGIERTTQKINEMYTWIGKYRDIRSYIRRCETCSKAKELCKKPKIRMGSLSAKKPLAILFIDFMTVDKASDGRESILVMSDAYTKYTKAIPTRDQTALTVAKVIMNEWIFNFGVPDRIHSDQGRNFMSSLIKELCGLFGIEQSNTTPYHPMGNGQVERMNRTIQNLLRTLSVNEKKKWPSHLNKLTYVYNRTPHAVTGYSPFYLMFMRKEKLLVDRKLGGITEYEGSDWVEDTRCKMKEVERIVRESSNMEQIVDMKYDTLEIGDIVRVKNRVLGRRKLQNSWGDKKWTVIEKLGDNAVYRIKNNECIKCENLMNLKRVNE